MPPALRYAAVAISLRAAERCALTCFGTSEASDRRTIPCRSRPTNASNHRRAADSSDRDARVHRPNARSQGRRRFVPRSGETRRDLARAAERTAARSARAAEALAAHGAELANSDRLA